MDFGSALQWFNNNLMGGNIGTQIGSAIKAFNNRVNDSQEAFNSAEAEKQRQWQEQMSNTEVQRRVADLKAAGLNPWMALNGGSIGTASTPSGASASTNSAFANSYAMASMNQTLANSITKLANSAFNVIGSIAKLI